jgi:hypothetical protein
MSPEALDWLEESADVIVDWLANSPDLSLIELLWAILKKLVKRFKSHNMGELESSVVAAWALIPQATIDKLCQGFRTHLQPCLAKGGEPISNDLCQISKRHALKDFLVGNQIYTPWIEVEDQQRVEHWLTIGPQWKQLSKDWRTPGACQLKNRWYQTLRHRFHDHMPNTTALATFHERRRRIMPVSQVQF